MDTYADDLATLIETLDLQDVVLIGLEQLGADLLAFVESSEVDSAVATFEATAYAEVVAGS